MLACYYYFDFTQYSLVVLCTLQGAAWAVVQWPGHQEVVSSSSVVCFFHFLGAWICEVVIASRVQANLFHQWMPSCHSCKGGVRCIICENMLGGRRTSSLVTWQISPCLRVRTHFTVQHVSHSTRWGRCTKQSLIYFTANINNMFHTLLKNKKFKTESESKSPLGQ